MLRNLIIVGVFVLCLWQAGEGDYQMLRFMALLLSFVLPLLIVVWGLYIDLQKQYDELRNKPKT